MLIPQHPPKFSSPITVNPKDLFLKSNKVVSLEELPPAPATCIFSPLDRLLPVIREKIELTPGPNIIRKVQLHGQELAVLCEFMGFGAPMWSWVFEQLICWGVQDFIYIGLFGRANRDYDTDAIYTVTRALRDEGTSYHYTDSQDSFAYPNDELTNQLLALGAKPAAVWTTDCMFRQTLSEIEYAQENDIAGFEMECSALFTIAKAKGVRIASLQVISDYYQDGKFTSIYGTEECTRNLENAVDMAMKVLQAQKEVA